MSALLQKTINIAPAGSKETVASLLQPDLRIVYPHRSKRLRALAENHAMKDYLLFAADIVDVQYALLQSYPLKLAEVKSLPVDWRTAPLSKFTYQRDAYWLELFDALLKQFGQLPAYQQGAIAQVLQRLNETDANTRNEAANALLAGDVSVAGSDGAPFYWAALSLYWAQMSQLHSLVPHEDVGVQRHICPVCGSEPVASVVSVGPPEGVRYLHCNLCETQWHYVRSQCSNCEQSGKVEYWSLDDKNAPVKTESCGDCHSHLKILYQTKDLSLDPVADDLASLALDARMEEEGFARSTVNPFLFPASS